ncbi:MULTISPECIES: hypothetical protein [Halocynthiibacter]|uniref:Uncharacterized protein n=1 Tax=Halocynthiibacter halioticoli TaxID=2986804 RepID=A0AAE3IZH8_9RHOB|nr:MULTISPECIES: hypothetical protein [Halocynthiibacter]MCV6824950.1 hypothetical protein [Halocynthiibacter halioticoli]MCW4057951.1 hypothetical protein [Halocynthiibacter sp. SDUM655004]MDE0589018.1 hypothetical protein [Halocynthiibacter sp. C4]
MRHSISLGVIVCAMLSACSPPPVPKTQFSEAVEATEYPSLKPLGTLLKDAGDVTAEPAEIGGTDSLRNRAKQISGPVIDPKTKSELAAAVERHSSL